MKYNKIGFPIILLLSCVLLISETKAQQKNVPLISSTREGVHIFIRGRYTSYSGFEVFRRESGFGKDYKLLTQQPVREINDIYKAQEILGTNWDYLKDFLGTQAPNQILLRMKSPDVATILRYSGVPFARVLGRYYFDNTAKWGKRYVYKIVLLSSTGRELQTLEVKYKVDDALPQYTTKLFSEQLKDKIKLKWNAPRYKEQVNDDFVGFNLYRSSNGKTERLNFLPVLRRENIIWFDKTVNEERTYDYLIKPVDILGREGEASATLSVYVKDLIPPLVPQGLTAKKGYEQIVLNWDKGPADDIVEYEIYRAVELNAKYSHIDNVSGLSTEYIDSTILGGKPYFYKLKAVDNAGNNSLMSSAIYSVAKDSSAPPPPSNITYEISEDNGSVLLNWEQPSIGDLQGYFVSRGYRSNQAIKLTPNSITGPKFVDKDDFHPGHTYYYYIAAIDLSFNQSDKSMIRVQIPDDEPPLEPKSCSRIKNKAGYIQISWQPSMSLDVKKYKIYRYHKDNQELLTVSEGKRYTVLDSTITKGKKYYYSVAAVDSFDNQSEEIKTKPIVARDIFPPPKPHNLELNITDEGVKISWSCPKAADLLGYNIYRSNSKYGSMNKINKEPVKNKQYLDKHGKSGKYYKITSFDSSKNETASKIYRVR